MPTFDLRGIMIAEYVNTNGTISYTGAQSIGDAMNVNIDLRFAEGRVYAESSLAEYIRKATGGTISIGVKYIPAQAQLTLFGSREKTRTINQKTVKSLVTGAKSDGKYVGSAFYAPDMIDGAEKFTCVKIARSKFGQPAMAFRTTGENIQFNTPTTTGEFMADHSTDQDMIEVAICDEEETAKAWVSEVLK